MPRIPEPLHALLANPIDYAGLYPPAGLPLPAVLENCEAYLASAESWMLNRLVLPAAKLPEVRLRDNWSAARASRDAGNQAATAAFTRDLL
jgi:hypothetical protein